LGIACGAYDYAREHAQNRVQFGQPLLKFDTIKKMLVEQAVQIESVRLMLYLASNLADEGKPFSMETHMALSQALTLAKKTTAEGIQICGGYGYAMEYDAQRYWRDAFSAPLNGQTAETINDKIAELAGL